MIAHAKGAKDAEDFTTMCQMSKLGVGEELVFIGGLYDNVPNVEMRSRSPADVLGGWVR